MRHFLLLTAFIATGFTASVGHAQSTVHAAWAQIMGSDGPKQASGGQMPLNLSLRFVDDDATTCPSFALAVTVPGQAETVVRPTWQKRSNRPGFGFDTIMTCQTDMDESWEKIRLLDANLNPVLTPGGQPVQLAGAARTTGKAPRLVVFGDTGCRGLVMTTGRGLQDCARMLSIVPPVKHTRFFFAELAEQAMQQNPDVVIHLGDYRYDKESQKDWDNWNSDFFSRVADGPLMRVPWAMVRGNHETCDRAGHGWYFLFGPNDDSIKCSSFDRRLVSSWYFDMRDSRATGAADPHRFIFVGTSPTITDPGQGTKPDCTSLPKNGGYWSREQLWDKAVCEFRQALTWSQERTPAGGQIPAWIVMHKPIWGLDTKHHTPRRVDRDVGDAFEAALQFNVAPECAPYQPDACGIKAILAAHEHMFTNVVFPKNALPQQYVIGNSGVRLDAPPGRADPNTGMSSGACKHFMSSLGMQPTAKDSVVAEYRGRIGGTLGEDSFGFVLFERDASEHSGWAGTAIYRDDRKQKLSSGSDFHDTAGLSDCRRPYGQ